MNDAVVDTCESAAVSTAHGPGCIEHAVRFDCEGDSLVGVFARPALESRRTGVLVVVGGPQYRAGSHRHFAKLSRQLAGQGWPVFRFDVRGMGDSSGALQAFEDQTPDIAAALDAFAAQAPGLQQVVLWGLCDGASAALLYLDQTHDKRVGGLVLLNPWVRSSETLAKAQVKQYYARRILDPQTWRALVGGRIGLGSLLDFGRSLARVALARLRPAPSSALSFQQRMTRGWAHFGGPSLLVLSGNDLTAREFIERMGSDPALAAAAARPGVTQLPLPDADHTLSSAAARGAHDAALLAWLTGLDSA